MVKQLQEITAYPEKACWRLAERHGFRRPHPRREWSREDLERMLKMCDSERPMSEIAEFFGTTVRTIHQKIIKHGKAAKRFCRENHNYLIYEVGGRIAPRERIQFLKEFVMAAEMPDDHTARSYKRDREAYAQQMKPEADADDYHPLSVPVYGRQCTPGRATGSTETNTDPMRSRFGNRCSAANPYCHFNLLHR